MTPAACEAVDCAMRVSVLGLVLAVALGASAQGPPVGAATGAGDVPDLAWAWSPEPRWLDGVGDANQQWFFGGLGFGEPFVHTTVANRDIPPVVIVFDRSLETRARVFDYQAGLADRGTGRFGGAAYDVSDPDAPRRLNVGFLEDRGAGRPNARWEPDVTPTGGHEYLLIFASDYDGTGETYAGQTGYRLDTYYGLAARVRDGHALYEASAEMRLTPAPLRDVAVAAIANGVAEVDWTAAAYTDATELRVVADGAVIGTADPAAGTLRITGLDPSREIALTVQLWTPAGPVGERTVSVRAKTSSGVASASHLDPGRAGPGTYADTWGYTAPDGTEYALLAVREAGLSVIDITGAPAAPPVEVGFLAAPPGTLDAKDVKVYGHHAYVVNESGPIQIVDLSDPAAPVQVGLLDVQPGVSGGGAHNVLVAEGHLWVTGGRTTGNAGVRVYSLAAPARPALTDAFEPTHQAVAYYHDFEIRDGIGYGAAIYASGGVDVLDVSDPSALRLLTTFTYPGAGAHNTCTTEDGATVYVGDEIGSSGNWIRIFDVADLDNPELVGAVVVDPEAVVHNCYVRGDRLYVAHYTEGLRVFDISDPHAPVETAYLDTYLAPGYGFRGAWTAYPYFASGKVIVSDLQSGLWVVTLTDDPVDAEPPPAPVVGLRAWPNPTAGAATLAYTLDAPAEAEVVVADLLGREVARLGGSGEAGTHRLRVETGALPAGVYVARLIVDGRLHASTVLTVAR